MTNQEMTNQEISASLHICRLRRMRDEAVGKLLQVEKAASSTALAEATAMMSRHGNSGSGKN